MSRERLEELGRVLGVGLRKDADCGREEWAKQSVTDRRERTGEWLETDLDCDGCVLCRETVSEDGLDVQTDDLEVDEQLERLGKVGPRQSEQVRPQLTLFDGSVLEVLLLLFNRTLVVRKVTEDEPGRAAETNRTISASTSSDARRSCGRTCSPCTSAQTRPCTS